MDEAYILQLRLQNQGLQTDANRSISEVVEHLGALQAQDYAMMKWAIGCRAKGSTEKQVEEALNRGDLLRTHVLRPTWHVVSPKNIHWMLELSAQRIRNKMKTRDRQLGLSESIVNRSKTIMVKALQDGIHRTKDEIEALWMQASIPTTEYRYAHLLMHAELDGLVCSGTSNGERRTYALMEERVPSNPHLSKEEALYLLGTLYFQSRWPATLQDFAWWSGLPMGDVRKVVELLQSEFQLETIGTQQFLLSKGTVQPLISAESAHLIPAFDEYIIAYTDRSSTLLPAQFQKVVSNNGFFRPAMLRNGKVIGTWKPQSKSGKIMVETSPFEPLDVESPAYINSASQWYIRFQTGQN